LKTNSYASLLRLGVEKLEKFDCGVLGKKINQTLYNPVRNSEVKKECGRIHNPNSEMYRRCLSSLGCVMSGDAKFLRPYTAQYHQQPKSSVPRCCYRNFAAAVKGAQRIEKYRSLVGGMSSKEHDDMLNSSEISELGKEQLKRDFEKDDRKFSNMISRMPDLKQEQAEFVKSFSTVAISHLEKSFVAIETDIMSKSKIKNKSKTPNRGNGWVKWGWNLAGKTGKKLVETIYDIGSIAAEKGISMVSYVLKNPKVSMIMMKTALMVLKKFCSDLSKMLGLRPENVRLNTLGMIRYRAKQIYGAATNESFLLMVTQRLLSPQVFENIMSAMKLSAVAAFGGIFTSFAAGIGLGVGGIAAIGSLGSKLFDLFGESVKEAAEWALLSQMIGKIGRNATEFGSVLTTCMSSKPNPEIVWADW
jgi:hypothetical protein